MNRVEKDLLKICGGVGLAALFGLGGLAKYAGNIAEEQGNNHETTCREYFQKNVDQIKETRLQNEDGEYVFEVDGQRCSISEQFSFD